MASKGEALYWALEGVGYGYDVYLEGAPEPALQEMVADAATPYSELVKVARRDAERDASAYGIAPDDVEYDETGEHFAADEDVEAVFLLHDGTFYVSSTRSIGGRLHPRYIRRHTIVDGGRVVQEEVTGKNEPPAELPVVRFYNPRAFAWEWRHVDDPQIVCDGGEWFFVDEYFVGGLV